MKKFYYYLIAAIVLVSASTATAKIADFKGKQVKRANKPALQVREKTEANRVNFDYAQIETKAVVVDADKKVTGNGRHLKATPLITAPEGESKLYSRSAGFSFRRNSSSSTGVTAYEESGNIEIVFGENNEVYFKDVLGPSFGSYIKGTLDGDQITVELPQTIVNNSGYNMEVAWLDISALADGTATNYYNSAIVADRQNTQAVFTVDGNTISLEGASDSYILAGVWDDDEMWSGYGIYDTQFTLLEELPEPIELPAGLAPTTYYLNGSVYYSSASHAITNQEVQVAKDGNDIYFQGLMTGDAGAEVLPDAWLKGTLDDNNTVTIPMGQYAGIYNGGFIYAVGYQNRAAGDFTMTYDPEAETFTFDNYLFVNGKADDIYYYVYHLSGNVISLEPAAAPELVELPEGVEPETDWAIEASGNQSLEGATQVAFDGDDVYFYGIPYYFPEAWIKGYIEDGVAYFPSGQYVGSDSYGDEFICSIDGSDLEFTYDEENQIFTLTSDYVLECSSDAYDGENVYVYYTSMKIYKGEYVAPEPVEVPEDLETKKYVWSTTLLEFEEDEETGDSNPVYTDQTLYVNIGVEGENVYVQGLCIDLPEAWVMGTMNADGIVTFATGQYFGVQETWFGDYKHYFVGYGVDGIQDVTFIYDAESDTYTSEDWIVDNESAGALNYYLIHTENVWGVLNEVPGKPQAPSITGFKLEGTSYPYVDLEIPLLDENDNTMNPDKVFYRIFADIEKDIQQLIFSPDDYESLDEELSEIPYSFDDDWDIYEGGSRVYLNQTNLGEGKAISDINFIGVQVVNYSGMEIPENPAGRTVLDSDENESEIVWVKVKDYTETGIATIDANATVKSVRYYSPTGAVSRTPFDGMNIVVKVMSDGTVRTQKVVK